MAEEEEKRGNLAFKALIVVVVGLVLVMASAYAAQVNLMGDHEGINATCWGGNYAEGGAYPCSEMLDNQTGIPVWNGVYNGMEFGKKWSADNVAIGSCSYMRGMGDIENPPGGGVNLTYDPEELWIEYSNDNITWLNFTNNVIDGNGTSQNDTRPGYQYLGSPTASYWTLLNFSSQETVMSVRMVVTYWNAANTAIEEFECYEAGALPAPPGAEPRANITFEDLAGNGAGGLTCPFTLNASSYNFSVTPYWNYTDVVTNITFMINGTHNSTNTTILSNASAVGFLLLFPQYDDEDYNIFFKGEKNTTGSEYTSNCTATADRVLPVITAFSPTNATDITAASLELAIHQADTHLHNFTYCISNATLGTNCLAYNTSILDGNLTWDTNDTTTNFTVGGEYWVNYTVCDDVNCVTEDIIFDYTVATQLGVSMLEDLTSQNYPQAVIAEYESDQGTANLSKWIAATPNATWTDRYGHEAQSFDDKMWVMGGVNTSALPHQWLSDVWYSTDGIAWTVATYDAPWEDRQIFGSAVFDDKLWIFGGQNETDPMNDVWSSIDGMNWVLVNGSAAFSRRHNFETLVFDNKIWIIGGANSSDANLEDVWYTSDGALWYPATYDGGFRGRTGFASTVHLSEMWIFGGTQAIAGISSDVWHSSDGVAWVEATGDAAWLNRSSPEVVTLGGMMWLSGGKGSGVEYYRDIWSSTDGAAWTLQKESAEFQNRTYHRMYTHGGRMWLTGGQNASSSYMSDVWYSTETISAAIEGATCNATSADGSFVGTQAMAWEAHFSRYQYNYTEGLVDGEDSRFTVECWKSGYEYQTDQANDTVDYWHTPVDAESFIASGMTAGEYTGLFMDYSRMGVDNPAESNETGPTKCALFEAEHAASAGERVKFVTGWKNIQNVSTTTMFLHPATAGQDGTGTGRYPNPAVNLSSCSITKPTGGLAQYGTCESTLEIAIGKDGYYYACARTWGDTGSTGVVYGNESATGTSIWNITGAPGTDWQNLNEELALAVITQESDNITSVITPGFACVAGTVTGQTPQGNMPLNDMTVNLESTSGVELDTDQSATDGTYQLCISEQQSNYTSVQVHAEGNASWYGGCWGGASCGTIVLDNGTTHENIDLNLLSKDVMGVDVFMWLASTFEDGLEISPYLLNQTTRANQTVYDISYEVRTEGGDMLPDDALINVELYTTCANSSGSEIGSSASYQSKYSGGKWQLEWVDAAGNSTGLWWQCLDGDVISVSLYSSDPAFYYMNVSQYRFEFANMEIHNPSLSPRDGDMNPNNYTWLMLRFGLWDSEDESPIANATCYGEILQPDGTPFVGIGPAWPQMSNTTEGYYNTSQNISFGNGTSFQWAANCTMPGYNDLNYTSGFGNRLTVTQGYFDVVDCFAKAEGSTVRNVLQQDAYTLYRCVLSTFSENSTYNNADLTDYRVHFDHSGTDTYLDHLANTTAVTNHTFSWFGANAFANGGHTITMDVDNVELGLYLDKSRLTFDISVRDWTYEPQKQDFFMTPAVGRGGTLVCMAELLFDGSFLDMRIEVTTDDLTYDFRPAAYSTVNGITPSLETVEWDYAAAEAMIDFANGEVHRVAYVLPNIASAYPNGLGLANDTSSLRCDLFVDYGGPNELVIDTMFGMYLGDIEGDFDWFGLQPWTAGLLSICGFSGPDEVFTCSGIEGYLYEGIVGLIVTIVSFVVDTLAQNYISLLFTLAGLVMMIMLFLAITRRRSQEPIL